MPNWAKCNGELVISQDFLEPDWKVAKDEERAARKRGEILYTCPDCGDRMHLVTIDNAGYRTQFFRHDPDTTCHREANPESLDHVRLKKAIFDICRKHGWEADVEVVGPGWKADVLAWRGDRRYAFEVQVSDQAGEKLAERSAKYRASGVTPVWLHKAFPKSCPFEIEHETFSMWGRTHRSVPPYEMHGARWATIPRERGLALVAEHLWRRDPAPWRMQTVLTYWLEGHAIIGTLEDGDTTNPRVRLWGRTTLIDAVTRVLTGDIERTLDAAVARKREERTVIKREAAATYLAKIDGVWRDFEALRAADEGKFAAELAAIEAHRVAADAAAAEKRAAEEEREREIEERRERARREWERIEAEARRKAEEEAATRALYATEFWWVSPDMFDMDATIARRMKEERAREELLAVDARLTAWERALRDRDAAREKKRLELRARHLPA